MGTVVCGDGAGRKGTSTEGKTYTHVVIAVACRSCSDEVPSITHRSSFFA